MSENVPFAFPRPPSPEAWREINPSQTSSRFPAPRARTPPPPNHPPSDHPPVASPNPPSPPPTPRGAFARSRASSSTRNASHCASSARTTPSAHNRAYASLGVSSSRTSAAKSIPLRNPSLARDVTHRVHVLTDDARRTPRPNRVAHAIPRRPPRAARARIPRTGLAKRTSRHPSDPHTRASRSSPCRRRSRRRRRRRDAPRARPPRATRRRRLAVRTRRESRARGAQRPPRL